MTRVTLNGAPHAATRRRTAPVAGPQHTHTAHTGQRAGRKGAAFVGRAGQLSRLHRACLAVATLCTGPLKVARRSRDRRWKTADDEWRADVSRLRQRAADLHSARRADAALLAAVWRRLVQLGVRRPAPRRPAPVCGGMPGEEGRAARIGAGGSVQLNRHVGFDWSAVQVVKRSGRGGAGQILESERDEIFATRIRR